MNREEYKNLQPGTKVRIVNHPDMVADWMPYIGKIYTLGVFHSSGMWVSTNNVYLPFGYFELVDRAENDKIYPHKCPRCKGPAYVGFLNVDCRNGCKFLKK